MSLCTYTHIHIYIYNISISISGSILYYYISNPENIILAPFADKQTRKYYIYIHISKCIVIKTFDKMLSTNTSIKQL